MNQHYTHNISYTSSDAQNKKSRKDDSSSSSSEKDYLEKNKSQNDWSQILIIDNSKGCSNRILSEEELKLTIRSYEDDKDKENVDKKNEEKKNEENDGTKSNSRSKNKIINLKNKKSNKPLTNKNNLGEKKIMILNNGIVLKNVNQIKKINQNQFKTNQNLLAKQKKHNNLIKPLNTKEIPNNIIEQNVIPNTKINFLLQKKQEKNKSDSYHIMYIKRPNRSFITKICKYKNNQKKKTGEFKRLNSSLGKYIKLKPNSSRFTPISTVPIVNRPKIKSKTLISNKIPKLIENTDNQLASLSTTSYKKYTINSNASLIFSKNNLIKRPLSSANVIRKEININFKRSKMDNYNTTNYNKSYNIPKTRFFSSDVSTNGNKSYKLRLNYSKNIMYENTDFVKQFKELKNAFEFYGDNNNLQLDNNYEDNRFYSYRENLEYIYPGNYKKEKKIIRKLNSAKFKGNSYHVFYPKEISPLYECKDRNGFEEEKQSKANNNYICSKCGYQKHFGNEKNCPICKNLKENNLLREENLSNKPYYFPFKDKYDTNNSKKRSLGNHDTNFNYVFNKNKDYKEIKTFSNPYYINHLFSSPNYKRKKHFILKNKGLKRTRSNTIEKFEVVKKYFG